MPRQRFNVGALAVQLLGAVAAPERVPVAAR